jgi:hypothetical protein
MGLLEEAIREHLDLKRARGADPAEIERLEREALGPVRREPVPANERPEPFEGEHALDAHSPIEFHDSTAPHWQQDEDSGEHHDGGMHVEVEEPAQPKRRGFLRRGRSHSSHEDKADAGDVAAAAPDYDDPSQAFVPEHFYADPGYHEPELEADAHRGHPADVNFDEQEPSDSILEEHPQAGGRFEPDYGPPTQLFEAESAGGAEFEADHAVAEPPAHAEPQPQAHHPILDDPPPEPTEAPVVEGERTFETTGDEASDDVEPGAQHDAPVPAPESHSQAPEAQLQEPEATLEPAGDPPPLRFEGPPRRPAFTTEPPGLGGSGPDAPPGPGAGGGDPLQRTTEFDVESAFGEESIDDDVLEETPEFLQDTPEHDRLWFEQRPPKDFDFDG